MAAESKRATLSRAFTRLGFQQEIGASRKYLVFRDPAGGFYYLGKSGALRKGCTIAGSLSLTDTRRYRELLAMGSANLRIDTPEIAQHVWGNIRAAASI